MARKLQEIITRVEQIEVAHGDGGSLNQRDERELQEILERLEAVEERLRLAKGDSGPLSPNKHLHLAIGERFNEVEFRELAHLLGINFEDIEGDGHADKILQFCLFIGRRGRTCELVTLLEALRPGVNWRRFCPTK